jgi:hypothetical protein
MCITKCGYATLTCTFPKVKAGFEEDNIAVVFTHGSPLDKALFWGLLVEAWSHLPDTL